MAATQLLEGKGISWDALVPVDRAEPSAVTPPDWRSVALDLATHPGITPTERSYVLKVSAWKAPGVEGLARLRAIAERLDISF